MRMRRLKSREEDPFRKQFEGVLREGEGCAEDVMESRMRKKSFFCKVEIVYI